MLEIYAHCNCVCCRNYEKKPCNNIIVHPQSCACTWTLVSFWVQTWTWRTIHNPQYTMSPSILLSLFLPLLTLADMRSLLVVVWKWNICKAGHSFRIFIYLKSPIKKRLCLSKLAGSFQDTEFSPCWWEGCQGLEITFSRLYPSTESLCVRVIYLFPLEYNFWS